MPGRRGGHNMSMITISVMFTLAGGFGSRGRRSNLMPTTLMIITTVVATRVTIGVVTVAEVVLRSTGCV